MDGLSEEKRNLCTKKTTNFGRHPLDLTVIQTPEALGGDFFRVKQEYL